MREPDLRIRLRLDRALARWGFVVLSLAGAVPELSSESVTMTAYLPAPVATFEKLVSTNYSYLAATSAAGEKVLIGATGTPSAKLDVRGTAKTTAYNGLAGYVDITSALVPKSQGTCTRNNTGPGNSTSCPANWYATFVTGMLPTAGLAGAAEYGPLILGFSGTVYYCCPCPRDLVAGVCTGTEG